MSRMEAFATKVFTTVKDLSEDVVPLLNAADEELARQWCGELPLQLPVPHSHINPAPSWSQGEITATS